MAMTLKTATAARPPWNRIDESSGIDSPIARMPASATGPAMPSTCRCHRTVRGRVRASAPRRRRVPPRAPARRRGCRCRSRRGWRSLPTRAPPSDRRPGREQREPGDAQPPRHPHEHEHQQQRPEQVELLFDRERPEVAEQLGCGRVEVVGRRGQEHPVAAEGDRTEHLLRGCRPAGPPRGIGRGAADQQSTPSAGSSRRARRRQNAPECDACRCRSRSRSSSVVMRKPLTTKNRSTPMYPPMTAPTGGTGSRAGWRGRAGRRARARGMAADCSAGFPRDAGSESARLIWGLLLYSTDSAAQPRLGGWKPASPSSGH